MNIAVANKKGGVGKTTTSLNLAGELSRRTGERVLVVDMDDQCSALDWGEVRWEQGLERRFGVLGHTRANLPEELEDLSARYKHIVIDAPAKSERLARSAMMCADLVLVPTRPSPVDLWSVEETLEWWRLAKMTAPALRCAILLNAVDTRTALAREARAYLQDLDDEGLCVLRTEIPQRAGFAYAHARGMLLDEHDRGDKGAAQVRALVREIEGMMGVLREVA